jgi:hypothetical protein
MYRKYKTKDQNITTIYAQQWNVGKIVRQHLKYERPWKAVKSDISVLP